MNEAKTFLEPMAGYLFDVVAKIRNRPYVPHSLMKLHNIKFCRDVTGATDVIEIGTYKGVTAKRLSKLFRRVITVEVVPKLYEISKERCKGRDNIELYLGDGAKLLPELAANVSNAVIFLDGHYSKGETGYADEVEPVLKELDDIQEHLENFKAVVVDDFRCFGVAEGWPKKSKVLAKLEDVLPSPGWQHFIINDQFVCIKKEYIAST